MNSAAMLRMALELAGDVAEVYAPCAGEPAARRGLRPMPDQDESGDMIVRVVSAELTEPFKLWAGKTKAAPLGLPFWSVFDLDAYSGEGGIRTLEAG